MLVPNCYSYYCWEGGDTGVLSFMQQSMKAAFLVLLVNSKLDNTAVESAHG